MLSTTILKRGWALVILAGLLTFSMSCEKDVEPAEVIEYSIFVSSSEGGSVSTEGGLYEEGATVVVEAIPNKGYVFTGWEGYDSTEARLEISVSQALSLKANFDLNVIEWSASVPHLVEDLVDESGYILAIENGLKTCYLMDHKGQKIKTWEFDLNLGQDAELASDGSLFGLFKVPNQNFGYGGQSGLIRQINPLGDVIWEYEISNENEITHHDLEVMPNGNVLVLVWYRVPKQEAEAIGYISDNDLVVEKVVEINPTSNAVVWEWNSWDHIVQNVTPEHATFGDPNVLRSKIDIFYNFGSEYHEFIGLGDVMHANGLSYQPESDLIALSINFYNEVWFIDHSTTTAEAKTNQGGQYNKGGDLLYRFGNPKAYGAETSKIFDFNHHPSFVSGESTNHLLIFNNNNAAARSKAMEFSLPTIDGSTEIGSNPQLVFEYGNEEMFFPRVGGAVRLPNGNTLICEGDFGFWEVNPKGQLLWKYDGQGTSFWRGLFYSKESEAIKNLGL